MRTEYDIFTKETFKFFDNTRLLLRDIIRNDFQGRDKFEILIENSFNVINEERGLFEEGILNTILENERTDETNEFDLLYLELSFFNSRYNYLEPSTNVLNEIKATEKLESASIVLESVKDLISRLPKWLQNVLTVLKEILGIAKAVIA
nr:hypothetical protein [uncultured Flavobacterium sp.]